MKSPMAWTMVAAIVALGVIMTMNGDRVAVTEAQANDEGLVAYYPFDQDAKDASGRGHDGIVSGATLTTDKFGNLESAYAFDGVDDGIEVADDIDFHFSDTLTIAAWVKPSRISGPQTIVNKWYALDSYALFLIDGNYVFSVAFPGGGWGAPINVIAPATLDTWTCVAGVYDGSAMTLYIDGHRVETAPANGPIQDSSRPISIGTHPPWNAFEGSVDEVRLYDRALTHEEIVALCPIAVDVDIKPGSDPNSINTKSRGVIPVALLSGAAFDATTVDPLSLSFGPGAAAEAHGQGHIEDVNGDGLGDLVVHFDTQESGLAPGNGRACVDGVTFDGMPLHGCDAVRVR